MRKLTGMAIAIFIIVLVLSFAKDMLVKVSVEKGTKIVTGLRLSIQSLRLGIINTSVDIKNIKLFNPRGFKDRVMVDMPEIYVDYVLGDIIKGKVHLKEMRINLKEFVVVKNIKGELNIDSLKVVSEQKAPAKVRKKEEGKMPDIYIELLELKIGKVFYKDYSKGGEPSVQEFNIGLNETYRDITDPNKLVSLIVVKVLTNTAISRLVNFDLRGLQSTVSDTLMTATEVTGKLASTAQETLKITSKEAGAVVGTATGVVKETVKDLSEAFNLPFGSKKK